MLSQTEELRGFTIKWSPCHFFLSLIHSAQQSVDDCEGVTSFPATKSPTSWLWLNGALSMISGPVK